MKRKLIADSSCDMDDNLRQVMDVTLVPFKVDIGELNFVDDNKLNREELLREMKSYSETPKTAAPSPHDFEEAAKTAEESFIVTISSKLSATYSNAMLAKNNVMEEIGNKVHVFDSLSASAGEVVVSLQINEWMKTNMLFEELVQKTEDFIQDMRTLFVLDSLDNLIKNGRMSKLAGFFANALSIKPILCGEQGEIKLKDKTRGSKKAYTRLVEIVAGDTVDFTKRTLVIAHCNAMEAATDLKQRILEHCPFKEVFIVQTGGLSTVYANEGGIVIAY